MPHCNLDRRSFVLALAIVASATIVVLLLRSGPVWISVLVVVRR
jgi:hypothetical protein